MIAGNGIVAAISGGGSAPNQDSLSKSLDALKELLLPHWSEDKEKRAKRAQEILKKEVAGGELKVKVVGKDKKQRRK